MLLLDNCSAHAPIETLQSRDGNIVAFLLPPNVTAAIQPMDQNPIRLTKLAYRKYLLSQLVAQEDVAIDQFLNDHKVREAILLLKQAWDDLPQSVLEKSWSKILNWDSDQFDDEDDLPLSELNTQNDYYNSIINETQLLLSTIAPNTNLNLEEIEEWNEDIITNDCEDFDLESEDSECDEPTEPKPSISYSTAIDSVNSLIKWCEENHQFSNRHISNLLALRTDMVVANAKTPKKQTKLTEFFEK